MKNFNDLKNEYIDYLNLLTVNNIIFKKKHPIIKKERIPKNISNELINKTSLIENITIFNECFSNFKKEILILINKIFSDKANLNFIDCANKGSEETIVFSIVDNSSNSNHHSLFLYLIKKDDEYHSFVATKFPYYQNDDCINISFSNSSMDKLFNLFKENQTLLDEFERYENYFVTNGINTISTEIGGNILENQNTLCLRFGLLDYISTNYLKLTFAIGSELQLLDYEVVFENHPDLNDNIKKAICHDILNNVYINDCNMPLLSNSKTQEKILKKSK